MYQQQAQDNKQGNTNRLVPHNGHVNKIIRSKNILNSIAKEDQMNDQYANSPISTPFKKIRYSTLRSEQLSSPEQTTLNLSLTNNQNGVFSGTFYGGMNSSQVNNSKQTLENVRTEYFQHNAQNQSSIQQNTTQSRVNSFQNEQKGVQQSKSNNLVPQLRLNKVISGYANQVNSIESLDIDSSSCTNRASKERKRSIENFRSKIIINGFFTERQSCTSRCEDHRKGREISPQTKRVLKEKDTNKKLITLKQTSHQVQQVNDKKNTFQQPKTKDENTKLWVNKTDKIQEEEFSNPQLEFEHLNQRRLSMKPIFNRESEQAQNIQRSQDNIIDGYYSPIASQNQINIQQQMSRHSISTAYENKQRKTSKQNQDGILHSSQVSDQQKNIIATIKNISTNFQQHSQLKSSLKQSKNQNQQISKQLTSLAIKKCVSNQSQQQKSPTLSSNNSKREKLNLKKEDTLNNQSVKIPDRQIFFLDQNEKTIQDGAFLKYKTESDLYKHATSSNQKNTIQFNLSAVAQEKQDEMNQNSSGDLNDKQKILMTKSVPNLDKMYKNNLQKIVNTIQKQQNISKQSRLQQFLENQATKKSNKIYISKGLNVKNQGDLIEFWNTLKEKIYAKNNVELVFKKNKFEQKCLNAMMEIVENINQLTSNDNASFWQYNQFIDFLGNIINLLQQNQQFSYYFLIRLYSIQGKFSYQCGNIYNALKSFLAAKRLANQYKDYKFKLKMHKHLGLCFKLIKDLRQAKSQFMKMLLLSWFLDDRDSELQSYDELGIVFYYECDIPLAQRLHQRLCFDIVEGEDSKAKQSAVDNFKQKLKYSDQQKNIEFTEEFQEKLKKTKKIRMKNQNTDIEEVNFSDSSDEEPDYYLREILQQDLQKQEQRENERMEQLKSENSQRNIKLRYSKFTQEREHSKEQDQIYQRIQNSLLFSQNNEPEKKKNPTILISHLSRNRSSNNYKETTVKEYQYFHWKKYQDHIQEIKNQQQSQVNPSIVQNFKRNSVIRFNDEQTPVSLTNIKTQNNIQQLPIENSQDANLFRFVVSNHNLKILTVSLEKLRKQILLLLENIERYESNLKNQNVPAKRNGFFFH
ncbi:hypothetical protein TTHERM_01194740 (macronuclear) [Tetrahymena thermophila SB210]|uniref:Uncharacterized protein n=1 Tax=Tetrahymena thermophila (strain SB210) TaxID=312017 RepID=Q22AK1_TETTS|nr:hypothetical protein TTHERM_01194740 [Tetrahymena thermophila SB210]EAR82315.2 hypothetical protein TTHERM_01194740 [Tetrahymena thermophila SB210]|eukprot:XP_001029978.2 hypothetical protein TTHERM_01194740 [Tetrahymena thermophila SB210]